VAELGIDGGCSGLNFGEGAASLGQQVTMRALAGPRRREGVVKRPREASE
jgi:hypothetical protein